MPQRLDIGGVLLKFLKCCGVAAGVLILGSSFVSWFLPSSGWVNDLANDILQFFAMDVCGVLPLLALLVLALLLIRRPPARSRFPLGHCQICGYDLTGNESGTCPECGAEVPSEPQESKRTR
jgi:hypothetical protein